MFKYLKVWQIMTMNSFKSFLISRIGIILFLLGKIIRFIFFLGFLVVLVSKTKVLAGYNIWHVILFFLTFNFVDATTQMLFREVYRFRQYVLRGKLDLLLVKPVNSLFRILFGGTDLLDSLTLLPIIIFIAFVIGKISEISILGVVFYILLVFNALIIAVSYHIFVVSLAILTTEVNHAIMIYRDIVSMGRIPIDIYREPLRFFITFFIPVGVMITFPVKALVGLLSPNSVLIAFVISFTFLLLSLMSWKYALYRYTSFSN